MKKRFFALLMAALCLLSACGQTTSAQQEDGTLTIVATTYPIYLLAGAVTQGVEGVVVERLDTGSTSCLHDYNLTVNDMKKIEGADIIALSGVGLEEFMEDALAASDTRVIDCSEGVELLENLSHHHDEHDHSHDGHDHGHYDPHYWMDARNMKQVAENISAALCELDDANAQKYRENELGALVVLEGVDSELRRAFHGEGSVEITGLVTFHDGFQYFAHAYGLPLLESIEEEAGSEASAREIVEITELVKAQDIPVIFTEVNGSDATANAIARETGCAVAQLSMCMDGPDAELGNYIDAMMENMAAVVNGFAGEEIVVLG